MNIKNEFIQLLKKDLNFKKEVKYLLDLNDIDDDIEEINQKLEKYL